jgi:Zn ribbon nucleic-acid-binding protein
MTDFTPPLAPEEVSGLRAEAAHAAKTGANGGMVLLNPNFLRRVLNLLEEGEAKVAKGQAFKSFVHSRFDAIGVPKEFPEGPHSKEGCRVGDRIDWIEDRLKGVKECCKCGAYRDIINEQAVEIARIKEHAKEVHQLIGYALGHCAKAMNGEKP